MVKRQQCVCCGASVEWADSAWRCSRCNVRMAPSDGKEASRLERYASIAIPIVLRCIAQKKIAS